MFDWTEDGYLQVTRSEMLQVTCLMSGRQVRRYRYTTDPLLSGSHIQSWPSHFIMVTKFGFPLTDNIFLVGWSVIEQNMLFFFTVAQNLETQAF